LVGAEIIISSEHIRNKTKPKSTNWICGEGKFNSVYQYIKTRIIES
jgi:hypothetical protein